MDKKSNSPVMRFKGFSEDWKTKKIGNILTEKNRSIQLEDNKEYQLVTVKRRNEGVISRGYLKGINILVKNYFQVKTGDYIISKRQVVHGANGLVPKNLNNAVVSNEYLIAASNENITTEYWALISKLPSIHKKFFLSSYGVDIEKLVFDVNDWAKRTMILPELKEQNSITNFFQNLDNLITLHQKKYDKLVILKKAMLVKMFPKNGAYVPEIRFKGFSEDWERKKLNEISTYHSSKLSVGDAKTDAKYQLYDANKVIGFTDKNFQPCKYVTIIKDGSGVGRVRLMPEKTSFIATMGAIRSTEVDILFLFCCLVKTDFTKHITGATIPHIYYSKYGNEIYSIPNGEEQQKIGSYFESLDNQLALHKTQLEKLNNIKKACFSKMFVAQE